MTTQEAEIKLSAQAEEGLTAASTETDRAYTPKEGNLDLKEHKSSEINPFIGRTQLSQDPAFYCNPTLTLTLHMADGCSVMDSEGSKGGMEGGREEEDEPQ
ncbi:hypothetical protein PAMP_005924 [Pampus punctatissimus]